MLQLIVSWALSAAALLFADRVFDGVKLKGDFADALWVAAVFSVLSFLFGTFFYFLLGVFSLGLGFLFSFVTQLIAAAIVIKMTSALSSRFTVKGFAPALGTAILLALAGALAHQLLHTHS